MPPRLNPRPESDFWLSLEGKPFLSGHRLNLLLKIAETGSLTQAGKAVGISYRTAWDAVNQLNAMSEKPLVESVAGGKKGGGTRLTDYARDLLKVYAAYGEEHRRFLRNLRVGAGDWERFELLAKKMSLKISARNQIWGKVAGIQKKRLIARVRLQVGPHEQWIAEITRAGWETLGLKEGDDAYALIKANWIRLLPGSAGGSARGMNRLRGSLLSMTPGQTTIEFSFQTPDGILLTVSHRKPAKETGAWHIGQILAAEFEAADVILGVPG